MKTKFRRKYNFSFRNRLLKEQEEILGGNVEVNDVNPDVDKLKSALDKEREQRREYEKQVKTFQKQLEAFSGIDPDLARRANEVLAQQQQWEEREAKLRQEVQSQFQPQILEREQQIEILRREKFEREQQLSNYKRDTILERSFIGAGGFENEFLLVAPLLRERVKLNPETGEAEVLGSDGKRLYSKEDPSRPATVEELIKQLQKESLGFARHFKGYEGGGMGINGNGRGMSGDPSWDNLPAWEKVSKLREQGKM